MVKLLLVSSADISAIQAKGNVETVADHNPRDVFEEVHVINPPSVERGPDNLFDSFVFHYTTIPRVEGATGTFFLFIGWTIVLGRAIWVALRNDVNVIRGQGPYLAGMVAVLTQTIARTPGIVSLHNDYDAQQEDRGRYELLDSRRFSEFIERMSISRASHVFVLTSYLEEYAVRHGADRDNVHVFPHNIDLDTFDSTPEGIDQVQTEYGLNPDYLSLVSVGRLVSQKDPHTLLEGYRRAKEEVSDIELVIVGDGTLRGELEQKVLDEGIEGVTFTGFVDRSKVANLMAASDAFVLPTLYEGFGYVFIEAMAASLPIVTTDIPHTSDVVDESVAILVPPKSPGELADAIKRLTDVEYRETLVENSHERFEQFSSEKVQDRIASAFERIAS